MKKFLSTVLAFFMIAALSGCKGSGEKTSSNSFSDTGYKIKNLDLEDAEIVENMPNTGKWRKMSFEFQHLSKTSPDKMVRFASSYGVNITKDDVLFDLYKPVESEFVPLSEYDYYMQNITKYEDYPFSSAIYNSGDFYMEVQAATGGMVELDNRKNVNDILDLGVDWEIGTWRPSFFCKQQASVDLSDENATCVLNGKTVKIVDAVKTAEKFVLENNILFPENFGAKVTDVDLFTYENGNQSLAMVFGYTIDGVPLEDSDIYSIEDEEGKKYKSFSCMVQIAMLTENTFDWIWFPAVDGGTEFTNEDVEISVTREQACEIVSKKLSQEYKFNVKEIQLMYAARRNGAGKLYTDPSYACIEPVWRFYITDIKAQEYSRLYVYVSAIDGEVQMSEVMR